VAVSNPRRARDWGLGEARRAHGCRAGALFVGLACASFSWVLAHCSGKVSRGYAPSDSLRCIPASTLRQGGRRCHAPRRLACGGGGVAAARRGAARACSRCSSRRCAQGAPRPKSAAQPPTPPTRMAAPGARSASLRPGGGREVPDACWHAGRGWRSAGPLQAAKETQWEYLPQPSREVSRPSPLSSQRARCKLRAGP
jgi:hypothetical protein